MEKIAAALIITFLSVTLLAGVFAFKGSLQFCEDYFPETNQLECVLSSKYRYDGD